MLIRHKGNYIFLFVKYIMYFCIINTLLMKKKLFTIALALFTTLGAHAQFEKDKAYVGASLSGIDLSYNGAKKLNLGVQANAGYFLVDNWMLMGELGCDISSSDDVDSKFKLGVGGRYYMEQNGLFVGVNAKYVHGGKNYNDFVPGVELGWAYFLNGNVTIEPSVYYDQSFKSHKDFSTIGLRLGIGIYLFKK